MNCRRHCECFATEIIKQKIRHQKTDNRKQISENRTESRSFARKCQRWLFCNGNHKTENQASENRNHQKTEIRVGSKSFARKCQRHCECFATEIIKQKIRNKKTEIINHQKTEIRIGSKSCARKCQRHGKCFGTAGSGDGVEHFSRVFAETEQPLTTNLSCTTSLQEPGLNWT